MAKRTFGDLVRQSKGMEGFKTGGPEQNDEVVQIPINQICCRSVNMYVDKQDAAESLKKSIEKLGLIEPIIVIEISSYKEKLTDERKEEIDYLTRMEEKGCRYFISSGHRRFKAFISIALNRDMYPGNQIDHLYSEETAKAINEFYDERLNGFPNGFKKEYRFYLIPCKIEKKLIENEDEFYNQSNTTQRELTNYEVIINTLYQLERSGKLDEYEERAKQTVVDGLSSRMLSEWINNFVKKGSLDRKVVSVAESDNDKRELLMTLPFDQISKTKNVLAEEISEYIFSDSGRKIGAAKILQTQNMIEQIDKLSKTIDFDIMNLVYAGEMNFTEAMDLSRITEKLTSQNSKTVKDTVKKILLDPINEAREKNQEIFQLKNNNPENQNLSYIKLSDVSKKAVKELKDAVGEKKEKKVSFSNQELIEFIYAIKRGDITAQEVIVKIESLNR